MLILFDNGVPAPLRHALKGHVVVEALERGWDRFLNGELIAAAEAAGFEVLLTTDKNITLPARPEGTENRVRGPRQSAMAYSESLCRKGRSRYQCRDSRQLRRGGDPV
jgi:hypothetical protein